MHKTRKYLELFTYNVIQKFVGIRLGTKFGPRRFGDIRGFFK